MEIRSLPAMAAWACACAVLFAQPRTHVVTVNADGSFSPQTLYIRSGDTVRWEQLRRTDSIAPASAASYPGICSARKPFSPADANEFTGPLPFAPSGVFTLSPLENGLSEATGSCPGGVRPLISGDGGKVLCPGRDYQATLPSTWQSDQNTGTFIRLLWKDVNPRLGVYDFTVLQRELEQAVRNGKLYSLGVKAGDDGTPDWIFTTNPNGSPRSDGGGVPRLSLQDSLAEGPATNCGRRMDLGNPTRAEYRQHYFAMLTEVAKFVKTRADWYRSLAYIKLSGANLISHENRLPETCLVVGGNPCVCNPAVFAADGYRPSGLYAFYDEQNRLFRDLFPGKAMSYALIQAGFPRVNESGGHERADGSSSNTAPLPAGTEQTETILNRGQANYGVNYVVQHNGVGPKPSGCAFEGVNPKPNRNINDYWTVGSGCPNRWAVKEGAEGQITGFQTNNRNGVNTMSELDSTFQNTWDNSDGVFLEIYEDVFWQAVNTGRGLLPITGKTVGAWAEDFHRRRNDPRFPWSAAAKNPFPSTHSHTFQKTTQGTEPQSFYYVHGMKCGAGRQEWGAVVIDAQPPSIRANGVASASAFGGSPSLAPGTWVEIFGSSLAFTTRSWASSDFLGLNAPAALDGVTVRIAGQAAYISYISPGQINVQVPSGVPSGIQPVTVTTGVGTSPPVMVNVNAAQPGLLAPSSFQIGGRQHVVALFADGATYVLPPGAIAGVASRRARPGDSITLYGIGFGPVTPAIPAGQIAQTSNTLFLPLQISIGGVAANVAYAGLAPGVVGLYQFNLTVPNIPPGDAVPVTFTLGGTPASETRFIAVGN